MRLNIAPIGDFGAKVTGVDLRNLDDRLWHEVEEAFLKYGVLIFPGQHLTAEEQATFGRRFGEFESNGTDGIFRISNDRSVYSNELEGHAKIGSRQWLSLIGNEGWHTDSTYTPVSSKAGLLSLQTKPPSGGGGTAFADMRAAYDALDEATKARIENLWTYNSLHYSQALIGSFGIEGKGYGLNPGEVYSYPMVKVHPATGRRALFIGRHSFGVPGMSANESAAFLLRLLEEATDPRSGRTLEHDWAEGDIAVWDNRCILHRARPYVYSEVRTVRGTRIAGEASERALEAAGVPSDDGKRRLAEELARVRRLWAEKVAEAGLASKGNQEVLFPSFYLPRMPRAQL